MKLLDVVVPTGMVHAGMTIGEAYRECVTHDVGGLPFCNRDGVISGRFSLRHIFLKLCIPFDMMHHAGLLGDAICGENTPEMVSGDILHLNVDDYIVENFATVSPDSPVVKALSIMEKFNTSYVFLIDGDHYVGVITRMRIASLLLTYHKF